MPLPTYDVQKGYYARALAVGIAVSVIGSVVWILGVMLFGGIPFVPSLIGMGIGYGAGELISLSVNRKRSTGLALIAAGSVIGAFLITWGATPFNFGICGLVMIIVGVLIAVQRVR